MKIRSLFRAFVFGLAFGFFYLLQVSVPVENASGQKGISRKILQKSGSPYGPEKRAKVLLPAAPFKGNDEMIFAGVSAKIAPAQNPRGKMKSQGSP